MNARLPFSVTLKYRIQIGDKALSLTRDELTQLWEGLDEFLKAELPPGNRVWQWTEEEDQKLLALRADGLTYLQVSAQMDRTPSSCANRAHFLKKR